MERISKNGHQVILNAAAFEISSYLLSLPRVVILMDNNPGLALIANGEPDLIINEDHKPSGTFVWKSITPDSIVGRTVRDLRKDGIIVDTVYKGKDGKMERKTEYFPWPYLPA